MSTAREEILDRIRTAVLQQGAIPSGGHSAVSRGATPAEVDAAYAALPRDYRRAHHEAATIDIVALFAERAADYRAVVERVPEAGLTAAIARVLAGSRRSWSRTEFRRSGWPACQPTAAVGATATDPAGGPPPAGSSRTTRRCPPATWTRWQA